MLVPGWIFADLELIKEMDEKVYEQLSNVACLPGIQKAAIAMPDAHWGYGFCLHPDSEVLMDDGFTIKIKDLENVQSRVLVFKGKKRKKLCSARIKKFFKVKPYNGILKIKTDLGNEIIASEDHPFYTQHGMLKAGKLKKGDLIATYLFKGVGYSKPSNKIIVNERVVLEKLESLGIDRKSFRARLIVSKLKQRGLLPLDYNHPKIPILIKLMGFLFGDGSMNFIGKRRDGILSFSGKKEDLETIREDIKKLGYTPSPLHRNGKEFVVNASSLLVLMYCLGVPLGNKSKQRVRVPAWLYKAEPWQKRLFISALFGCELRKPYPRKNKKANFSAPVLTVGKEKKFEKNAYEYLNDIKNLLNEFGIKVLYIKKHREHKAKDGTVSVHIDLVISPSTENLIRLYEKVSYLYNSERKWLADVALAYLRFKREILKEKEKVIPIVERLLNEGTSYRKIAKALATANPISERFLMDVCWKVSKGKKDISPLVPKTFPTFEDFVRERTKGLGKSGLVWAKIKEIKEVEYDEEFVYDLTVDDEDHNFIANGFVVSNCIGGVAAFDPEENGVISVGGVGFDINCLSGDSSVLFELGYRRKIKDMKKDFNREKVVCFNPTKKFTSTKVAAFMCFPAKEIIEVETFNGFRIKATRDHPFLTLNGMKELRELKEGDIVCCFPFEGVEYEKPSDEIIIDDTMFNGYIRLELKKRKLLPLSYNHPALPYILKVMGYVLGDGGIYFTRSRGVVWFFGEKEDLEKIRDDIKKIGFTPSRIYSRKREHHIKTFYGDVKFKRVEYSFKVTARSFAHLLCALGVPKGDKASQPFRIPAWLFKCPLWQKRLFLASFFGAELSSPCTVSGHGKTFAALNLCINKREDLLENGKAFLADIAKLLSEFGVKSKLIKERFEYEGVKGKKFRLRLVIPTSEDNLIRFFKTINYEYNRKKRFLGCLALSYLLFKKRFINVRKAVEKKIDLLKKKGYCLSEITDMMDKLIAKKLVNRRFIKRSYWKDRKSSPRIPVSLPSFEEYVSKITAGLGKYGHVWDKIVKIKKCHYDDYVYDLTVCDEGHNFVSNCFVVSNCGIATLKTNLMLDEVKPKIKELVDELFARVPAGLGSRGEIKLSREEQFEVMKEGAKWVVEKGYGYEEDLDYIEENGKVDGAVPENVSETALKRERGQVGTLGSGNHYLEVQYVDEIYDEKTAKAFGFERNQILVTLHCGSRALGHQIGTDYLKILAAASRKYGIKIRERELVCAPINSPEGQRYFGAVNCAINYAFANRQVIAHLSREAFKKVFPDAELKMFYNIGHNTVKVEWHDVDGKKKRLYVHRKGSTRSFGPGREELPKAYREIGQPVIIGGTMGTCSYILVGTKEGEKISFGSVCHGAGRTMSRHQAKRTWRGTELVKLLWEKYGIYVRAHSMPGLAEEAPGAYKDVTKVVDVIHNAGLAKKVIKVKPLGVIKG